MRAVLSHTQRACPSTTRPCNRAGRGKADRIDHATLREVEDVERLVVSESTVGTSAATTPPSTWSPHALVQPTSHFCPPAPLAPPFDGAPLTLTSADAARAGKLLNARWIVPLQIRGWAHFSEGPASIDTAFRRRHERPVATPHPGPDHHPYLARVTATCQRQPRGVRVAADFRWRKCGNADCGKRAIVAARDRHDSGIGSPRAHRAPVQ
jgi:hypothetical protein